MCYNCAVDVCRIQYYFFSSECQMYPHLVGSTFFLVFVVTIYILIFSCA